MLVNYLIWVFLGLFFIFGALVVTTDGMFWRQIWAGLSMVSIGGFMISFIGDALATGQIRARYSVVPRANQPLLFWIMVIFFAAAGVAVLISGIWFLFFKD